MPSCIFNSNIFYQKSSYIFSNLIFCHRHGGKFIQINFWLCLQILILICYFIELLLGYSEWICVCVKMDSLPLRKFWKLQREGSNISEKVGEVYIFYYLV